MDAAPPDSGERMIVNSAAYADGRKLGDVEIEDISEVLRFPGQFVWIGLREPDAPLMAQIQEEFALHELAVEDALRAHQRPKLEEYGSCLFAVLRTAHLVEGKLTFGETHVFVGENYVVSLRHGASLSYAPVRRRCESVPDLLRKGPAFVLYAIMDFVVDQYFPAVDALEDEQEELEDAIFGSGIDRDATERVYELKRELVAIKRAVSPLVEMCNRLMRFDQAIVHQDMHPYFRDVYDHVIRINESVDTLRELLGTALEANLSLISIRQNDVMKKLAAWAAILAVPTAISGIFGMNFEVIPAHDWTFAFPAIVTAMMALGALLHRGFRRAGWL